MVKNPYFSPFTPLFPSIPSSDLQHFSIPRSPPSSIFTYPLVLNTVYRSHPRNTFLPRFLLTWSDLSPGATTNGRRRLGVPRAHWMICSPPLLRVPLHLYFSFCSLHSPPFPSAFFSVHSCLNNSQNHIWHLISLPLASLWRSSGKTFKDTLGFCGDLCGLDVGRWGLNVEASGSLC